MTKKAILTLNIIFLIGSTSPTFASTWLNHDFHFVELSRYITLSDTRPSVSKAELVNKDASYTEFKDSAERRGTENWEEPQGSFFVVPGVILGIIALALFFNRN